MQDSNYFGTQGQQEAGSAVPGAPYAVTADGQRFLLNTIVDESGGAPLTVWLK